MREIRTSGSVRDGGGDVPIYSALEPAQHGQAPDEHGGVGKSGERAEEAELSGLERRPELLQKQPPEQPRQYPHRQEKAGPAGNPARAV